MNVAASGALLQYARGMHGLDCIDFHEQPDAQLLAYQRIIKQVGVVLAVYAPDLADGSAEDKAVSYCACTGQTGHADSSRNSEQQIRLNVPTEKAP